MSTLSRPLFTRPERITEAFYPNQRVNIYLTTLNHGTYIDTHSNMELKNVFNKISQRFLPDHTAEEQLQAGTGFMLCLSDVIHALEKKGYTENLVPEFDHFRFNQTHIYPKDFFVDEIVRFENSSDPDDQAILYAINSHRYDIKGLYVESYGLYHDSLSPEMLERIKFCQKKSHEVSAPLNTLSPIDDDITI